MTIQDIREGKDSAYRYLYDNFYESLYNTARAILKSSRTFYFYMPEDIVSDALMNVFTKRSEWDSIGGVVNYLFKYVKFHSLSVNKADDRRTRLIEKWPPPWIEETVEDTHVPAEKKSSLRELRKWVSALPDSYSKYLKMTYFDGLTDDEIYETEKHNIDYNKKKIYEYRCLGVRVLTGLVELRKDLNKIELVELMLSANLSVNTIQRETGVHIHVLSFFRKSIVFEKDEYGTREGMIKLKMSMEYATPLQKKIAPLLLRGYKASEIAKAVGMNVIHVYQAQKILAKRIEAFLTFNASSNPFKFKQKQLA